MKSRVLSILVIAILLVFISIFPVKAAIRRQVVIIDVPRLDLADISPRYPYWTQLLNHGSIGLVSVAGANTPDPSEVNLYFNCGVLAKFPKEGFQAFDSSELINNLKAKDLYQSFTGIKISPREAVNLNINEIKTLNSPWEDSRIGFLGRYLHRLSLKTAVIGNSDSTEPARFGAALIMDQNGRIDYGAVGPETLRKDAKVPFGFRTDSPRILKKFTLFQKKADLIVVTLGDLERIERFRNSLSGERRNEYQRLALRRYDKLLARLTDKIDFTSTLLIIYTCLPPSNPQNQNTTLTPIIIRGPGFQPGILTSATTRKSGIITYSDLRIPSSNF